MSSAVRKYSPELKEESVKLILKSPSINQASRELGIPLPTLYPPPLKLRTLSFSLREVSEAMRNVFDRSSIELCV